MWLDYRTMKAIGRTHCWCSMNPFWSRKHNRDLSLQFCPYGQCDLHISVLRSTLLNDLDYFWIQNSHVQRTKNWSSVSISANLKWPWDSSGHISPSTYFPLPFLSVKMHINRILLCVYVIYSINQEKSWRGVAKVALACNVSLFLLRAI